MLRKSGVYYWLRKNRLSLLFVLPGVAFVVFFIFYPITYQLYLSFFQRSGWAKTGTFVGLGNYRELFFQNPRFWHALQNNLVYTGVYVTGVLGIGLVLALLIDSHVRGWRIYRFIYYLPVMFMVPVTAVLWRRIYHPIFGILNTTLKSVGLETLTHTWLGEQGLALFAIIVAFVWKSCGWPMIIFLAAMSNIPATIYDAASIDGCSLGQRVRFITLPMIKYIIGIVLILQVIWSLKVFTEIWNMTRGGPGYATEVVSIYLFYEAFFSFRMGYASAMSVVFSIFILLLAIAYIKAFGQPTFEY